MQAYSFFLAHDYFAFGEATTGCCITHTHTHAHTHTRTHTHAHTRLLTHYHSSTRISLCIGEKTYGILTHSSIQTHILVHTDTHRHTHRHTHIFVEDLLPLSTGRRAKAT